MEEDVGVEEDVGRDEDWDSIIYHHLHSNRDFGLQNFQLMSGKSFRIEERLKTQSGEENSSSGRFCKGEQLGKKKGP